MSAGISQIISPNDDPSLTVIATSLTVIATNVQETDEQILDVAREIVSHFGQQRNSRTASCLRGKYS